jgi:Gpi18-like mannosyltransferase
VQELPDPAAFFTGVVLSAALAALVFWHADKHGNRRATTWGIVVFLFAPVAFVYFGRYWMRRR